MNANARFPIMKAYHGLVFSRNGRVLDVQCRTPWTTFINNDRYIRVEVEFSASLDEAFGVATSKQHVSLSPEMWDRLCIAGLPKAIEHLRSKVRAAKAVRQRAVSEPYVAAGDHVSASRGAHAAAASAITTNPATSHFSGGKLSSLVCAAIDSTDHSLALSALLRRIERRMSDGEPWLVADYRGLLNGWVKELLRVSSV